MGSLSNLRSFLTSHLHVLSPKDQHDFSSRQQQNQQQPIRVQSNNNDSNISQNERQVEDDHPRFYSIFSELTAMERQREQAKNQFPCEDRHSFNPHYQHNLIYSTSPPGGSTSMLMSSPPSLTSSLSSTNSSYSSLSRASVAARSFGYRSGSYYGSHHHQHQQQLQQQLQHSQSQDYYKNNAYHNSNSYYNGNHNSTNTYNNYSYNRQQNRRLNQAQAQQSNQQYEYFEDAMVRYDHQQSASSFSSLSALSVQTNSIGNRPRSTSRGTVTFSPVTEIYPQLPHHGSIGRRASSNSSLNVSISHLPSISEAQQQRTSPAMDRRRRFSSSYSESDDSTSAAADLPFLPSVTVTAATSSTTSTSAEIITSYGSNTGSHDSKQIMTAHQSLRRIAQISTHEDGWCTQKAGQYTRQYAETRPRGAQGDGRRNRRL